MNPETIVKFFFELRKLGFNIGLNELADAIHILENNKKQGSFQESKELISFLWCNNLIQKLHFELTYSKIFLSNEKEIHKSTSTFNKSSLIDKYQNDSLEEIDLNPNSTFDIKLPNRIESEKIQTFPFTTFDLDVSLNTDIELYSYSPLTKRSMAYIWRYLRIWKNDGPNEIIDIDSTIKSFAHHGIFSEILFKRSRINHAKLLLLVDRNGSMIPFHRYIDDMVETALSDGTINEVKVCYFHNNLAEFVYLNPNLTEKMEVDYILNEIDQQTSVLFLSDAGAARGNLSFQRIQQTHKILLKIKKQTDLFAWINPMPSERWYGTTASVINQFIPMFQMDSDGFSNAIDVLRGLKVN